MNTMTLNKFWWLWVPIAFMAINLSVEMFLPTRLAQLTYNENGVYEIAQAIVIFMGLLIAASIMFIPVVWRNKYLLAWVSVAGLACLYITGEEISWGQHIFDWATPDHWANVNDQGETNLHNTSSWLDQKPRLILLIGIVIGGLIIPALHKWRPACVPQKFNIIYPPAILGVTAFFVLLVKVIDNVDGAFGVQIFGRASESEELYMFYFVLLYLVVLRRRLLQHQR